MNIFKIFMKNLLSNQHFSHMKLKAPPLQVTLFTVFCQCFSFFEPQSQSWGRCQPRDLRCVCVPARTVYLYIFITCSYVGTKVDRSAVRWGLMEICTFQIDVLHPPGEHGNRLVNFARLKVRQVGRWATEDKCQWIRCEKLMKVDGLMCKSLPTKQSTISEHFLQGAVSFA